LPSITHSIAGRSTSCLPGFLPASGRDRATGHGLCTAGRGAAL
jgi:hypothetical protein